MLPREGLACRLQVMGWHGLCNPLFPEVPEAGGAGKTSTGAENPLWDPCGLCDLPSVLQGGSWERVALVLLHSSAS